ncbi:hypothetical protein [Sabulibacter ruber]|uniref:hypothetical protein n=1 Tax=Sabulibacter ruber TaxID=2811901 RepID=UPI001A9731FA|nr:hypothetical protein [Sabulibacter ruber]
METKEKSIPALQQILHNLRDLEEQRLQHRDVTFSLLTQLHEASSIFQELLAREKPGEQTSTVINYCLMKLEMAIKQVEFGNVGDGLSFSESVILYFLHQTSATK